MYQSWEGSCISGERILLLVICFSDPNNLRPGLIPLFETGPGPRDASFSAGAQAAECASVNETERYFEMDINQRLFRLLKAIAEDKVATISRFIEQGDTFLDEKLDAWEKAYGLGNEPPPQNHTRTQADTGATSHKASQYTSQFVEDLKVFGLTPPSSFEAVKQARNQELKKFHPDKYQNDPQKMEIAKRIVQIYNSAYERLKLEFGRK